jgi:3-methyladenine DNA glycosylase AlkC
MQRKGYNSRAAIPPQVMAALNRGEEEPLTLSEWLAVDVIALMQAVAPAVGLASAQAELASAARAASAFGTLEKHRRIGMALRQAMPPGESEVFATLASHRSGVAREWAAWTLAANPDLPLPERIQKTRRFALDPSMNVREIAWMSLRPYLAAELDLALQLLPAWVADGEPYLRRCAVEASRPRGVWCSHIAALKTEPQRGLPLLEPLRAEEHPYAQRSVANWLNDASKSQPEWVEQVCARWLQESDTPATRWIVNHARRSLRKAK